MKITKNNLKKFNTASCSQEETSRINNWLLSNKDEHTNLTLEELSDIKLDMWTSITDSTSAAKKHKVIPLYKKVMRYVAVACLVLGLVSISEVELFKTSFMSTKMALANTTESSTQIETAGMNFTLIPNSKVNVETNLITTKSRVEFCGNMKIKNNTDSKINAVFTSSCGAENKKEIALRKNKSYYAFTLIDKGEEKLFIMQKP